MRLSLTELQSNLTPTPRVAIVGVGNELCGDDAVGSVVAHNLLNSPYIQTTETFLAIQAGVAIENITGQLRSYAPDLILIIDAADMGEAPGVARLLPLDVVSGVSAFTHSLPLSMVMRYLTLELHCPVFLLGIQIRSNDMNIPMSPEVLNAAEEVTNELYVALNGEASLLEN